VRIADIYYAKLKTLEFIIIFFALFGLGISILENEIHLESTSKSLLSYNVVCTLFLMMALCVKYKLYIQWCIHKRTVQNYDTIYSKGWHKPLIAELILAILIPYPGLDKVTYKEYNKEFDISLTYNINKLLLFVCFGRVYHLIRAVLFMTKYMNPRS